MGSDRESAESFDISGIRRINTTEHPPTPPPFLTDGGSKFIGDNKDHISSSHGKRVRRTRIHKIKKILTAMIPFAIFMVGLSLVSVGFFAYVENESVLAIFITSRDKGSSIDYYGLDSTGGGTPAPTEIDTVVAVPDEERLVVPFYYQGDQIGTLHITSVDIEVGVYQGDSEDEFQLGAGHYSGSFLPAQKGNIVLAAHRTTYFKNLEQIKTGDTVEFETTYGQFTYEVREINILDSADFRTITKTTDEEQLTLYTCYPFIYIGNAPQRYVVRCDLVASELNT